MSKWRALDINAYQASPQSTASKCPS